MKHWLWLLALAACGDDVHLNEADARPGLDGMPPDPVEQAVINEGWTHVATGTPIAYAANPPASGPHYGTWGKYSAHTSALPRGHYVHDLEHGAIVLLYRPDAPVEVRDALAETYRAIPDDPSCGHKRALLTADSELDVPVAAVAANVVLKADFVAREAILTFVTAHRGKGPENVCADGSVE